MDANIYDKLCTMLNTEYNLDFITYSNNGLLVSFSFFHIFRGVLENLEERCFFMLSLNEKSIFSFTLRSGNCYVDATANKIMNGVTSVNRQANYDCNLCIPIVFVSIPDAFSSIILAPFPWVNPTCCICCGQSKCVLNLSLS